MSLKNSTIPTAIRTRWYQFGRSDEVNNSAQKNKIEFFFSIKKSRGTLILIEGQTLSNDFVQGE